ncbi:8193_t:CDS:1, partial [Paraglomus occultum]
NSTWNDPKYNDLILNSRGNNLPDLPLALYHPVFAEFVDDLSSIQITDEDCDSIKNLLFLMSASYENENERVNMFRSWASEYFHTPVTKLPLPQTIQSADAGITHNVDSVQHLVLLGEAKNELGDGSGCAYIQACASYTKFVGSQNNPDIRYGLNPAFIVYFAGATLGIGVQFLGVVKQNSGRDNKSFFVNVSPSMNSFTMHPLVHSFHLLPSEFDIDGMIVVVRAFCALKRGIESLRHYYDELKPVDIDNLDQPRHASYPYIRFFKDADNAVINFEYKRRLYPISCYFWWYQIKMNKKATLVCSSSL